MDQVFWFLAGVLASISINFLTDALFPSLRTRVKLFFLRQNAKKLNTVKFSPSKFVIAGKAVEWTVLAFGEFRYDRIRCKYSDEQHVLPIELQTWKDKLIKEAEDLKTKMPNHGLTDKPIN